jgi:hypothetical protein
MKTHIGAETLLFECLSSVLLYYVAREQKKKTEVKI